MRGEERKGQRERDAGQRDRRRDQRKNERSRDLDENNKKRKKTHNRKRRKTQEGTQKVPVKEEEGSLAGRNGKRDRKNSTSTGITGGGGDDKDCRRGKKQNTTE